MGQAPRRWGAVVVGLGVGELTELVVPVGFQGFGDQPVGGVDGQVTAAGGVGGVLGALDVGGADLVGLGGGGVQLVRDGERDLEGEWGERFQGQISDRRVDGVALHVLADRVGVGDAVALADVLGHEGGVSAAVVANGHAP